MDAQTVYDNCPSLWGSTMRPIVEAIHDGDQDKVGDYLLGVWRASNRGEYTYTPDGDTTHILEVGRYWDACNPDRPVMG